MHVDEPEVIYLQTLGSARIVAVASDLFAGEFPFFGAEVSEDQWKRYLGEKVDLRYLLMYPKYKRWYEFDLNDSDSSGFYRLTPTTYNAQRHSPLIPESGFFARSHTAPVVEAATALQTQSFEVDGAWDLNEFSSFYGKVSDLYAFLNGLKNWVNADLSNEFRRKIRDAFLHPWRGGFSYVAFFDDLFSAQPVEDRLGVRSIQYASPGHIDVDGNGEVFASLREMLAVYAINSRIVKDRYNAIYSGLSKGGYLKMSGEEFEIDNLMRNEFFSYSEELLAMIGLGGAETVHELSSKNSLVTLKATLALVRRMEALYGFFAEGRAKLPNEDVVEIAANLG